MRRHGPSSEKRRETRRRAAPVGADAHRPGALAEALAALAPGEALTARELSGRVGAPEKQVAEHLVHLQRSLRASERPLELVPAACAACGFTFRDRRRLTRPGACPKCRSTRVEPPAFRLG